MPWTTNAIEGGLRVDAWLKQRPHSPFENQLLAKIGPEPYRRTLTVSGENYTIIAHVDDFAVEYQNRVRTVIIEENKTAAALKFDPETGRREYNPYSLGQAEFQLRGYCWVLKPTVETAGYVLGDRHWVRVYRRRDARLMKSYPVRFAADEWARSATEIIQVWRGERPLIPPMARKCVFCNETFKNVCPLWKTFTTAEKLERTKR